MPLSCEWWSALRSPVVALQRSHLRRPPSSARRESKPEPRSVSRRRGGAGWHAAPPELDSAAAKISSESNGVAESLLCAAAGSDEISELVECSSTTRHPHPPSFSFSPGLWGWACRAAQLRLAGIGDEGRAERCGRTPSAHHSRARLPHLSPLSGAALWRAIPAPPSCLCCGALFRSLSAAAPPFSARVGVENLSGLSLQSRTPPELRMSRSSQPWRRRMEPARGGGRRRAGGDAAPIPRWAALSRR